MLKDLVKLANRLDQLGLIKEADLLDRIIKKATDDYPEYEGSIVPITKHEDIVNMILNTDTKDIKDLFKKSCNDLINMAKKVLTPESPKKLNDYLDLIDPRYSGIKNDEELAEEFGEDRVELLARQPLEYNPEDFISAANQVYEDTTGRYFPPTKTKPRAKRLLDSFNEIADEIFHLPS